MEKILALAREIFGHVETVEPQLAAKVKMAVSDIVEEAHGLSNAFALAVASSGKVNATSPSPTPKGDAPAVTDQANAATVPTPDAPVFLHPIYGTPVK